MPAPRCLRAFALVGPAWNALPLIFPQLPLSYLYLKYPLSLRPFLITLLKISISTSIPILHIPFHIFFLLSTQHFPAHLVFYLFILFIIYASQGHKLHKSRDFVTFVHEWIMAVVPSTVYGTQCILLEHINSKNVALCTPTVNYKSNQKKIRSGPNAYEHEIDYINNDKAIKRYTMRPLEIIIQDLFPNIERLA